MVWTVECFDHFKKPNEHGDSRWNYDSNYINWGEFEEGHPVAKAWLATTEILTEGGVWKASDDKTSDPRRGLLASVWSALCSCLSSHSSRARIHASAQRSE